MPSAQYVKSPVALFAFDRLSAPGVEIPKQFPGRGIERNDAESRCRGVKDAVYDDRIALQFRAFVFVAGIEPPGLLKLLNVLRLIWSSGE